MRDARAAIEANGWTLAAPPFIDQGVSGAEFTKRARLQALYELAHSSAIDVVVVRDQKRIGRDAARATHALVELDNAGVRTWSYQDQKYIELGGTGFIVTAADGHAAESERKTNNTNIRRALRVRAEAGLATGFSAYGYRSVPVEGGLPNRNGHSPMRLVVDEAEATVVVGVFQTFVDWSGSYRATAVALNRAGVPSPSGKTWSHAGVRKVLARPHYRGISFTARTARSRSAAPASVSMRLQAKCSA